MKILVCDDKPREGNRTREAIGSHGDVEVCVGTELQKTLKLFFRNVSKALNGSALPRDGIDVGKFSGYDLALVDNNLTGLDLGGPRLTAETIIGYLRAFTDMPYIVSLNKNLHVDFDLRFLYGDYQSLADLALNTRHLSNSCLWDADPVTRFAPWYWPRLSDVARKRQHQVEFVAANLKTPVWAALDFPDEADDYLSLRAKAGLASSGDENTRDATFETFFANSRALLPAERQALLAARATDVARRAIERVAAYEVDRWLRRDVMCTQDVLIDLPHLIAQMPFLLGDRANQLDSWNHVVRAEQEPFGLDTGLFRDHVRGARFAAQIWTPMPCFWWPTVRAKDGLKALYFEADDDWPDAVFCEDVSRFVPMEGGEEYGPPKEFEAEIAGSWARRYIVFENGYEYSPRSRIVGSAA